jgi:hypothetical protein
MRSMVRTPNQLVTGCRSFDGTGCKIIGFPCKVMALDRPFRRACEAGAKWQCSH